MKLEEEATIFDIQRFCIHDGPGIRTVVFLKGCGLACRWCHNPEAADPSPQLGYRASECLEGCDRCVTQCPEGALSFSRQDRVNYSRCTDCAQCISVCPTHALRLIGQRYSPRALLDQVLKDLPFFRSSGGGITLSGGEPVLHSHFLQRFLPLAHDAGLHVTLETAGFYPYELLEPLLPQLQLILFDLKLADETLHLEWTGQSNRRILENLARLVELGVPLQVRMPVVPGVNTDAARVDEVCAVLHGLQLSHLQLLPYNHLWEAKLQTLRSQRAALGIQPWQAEAYRALSETFAQRGIQASVQ